MTDRFEMSMMKVLTFFLRVSNQTSQRGEFSLAKQNIHVSLKKFGMNNTKSIKTPMDTSDHLDLDLNDTSID
jgi:hypothetical protein